MNHHFGPNAIETAITDCLAERQRPRILEIGCGEGRVLMELFSRWPNLVLHGINLKPWTAMSGAESLVSAAHRYGIPLPSNLDRSNLPHVEFYDAEHLQFEDKSLDLIISQVSMHFIQRKDLALKEIWRTLRPGGVAWLHMDTRPHKAPDFMENRTPRFNIHTEAGVVALDRFVDLCGLSMFKVWYNNGTRSSHCIVKIMKRDLTKLVLPLQFDSASSFDLNRLNYEHDETTYLFGYRSVYRML